MLFTILFLSPQLSIIYVYYSMAKYIYIFKRTNLLPL